MTRALIAFCGVNPPGKGAHRRQAGFSLLEMLIAMGLGLLLVLGIGTIFIGSNQTYNVQEENARIQETGRSALDIIGRAIRQAGADAPINTNPAAITVECVAPACTAISGTNNTVNNGINNTDTLAIQLYANPDENNAGAWGTRDCTGGFAAAGALMTNTFAMNGTDLRCTGSVGGVQPLLPDIEDFQVLYGVDAAGNDQSADLYTATPNAAQLPVVVSVRVCVLVRSTNPGVVTGANQSFLNCEGALGLAPGNGNPAFTAAGDRRLRRAFVATYNLRNRISILP